MSTYGYIYIPEYCQENSCRLHITFHGCWQIEKNIGQDFVWNTEYNEYAESNNLIVLYPQLAET